MTLHAEIRRLSRALLPGLDSRGQRTSVGLWAEFGAIVLSDVAEQMITPSHGLRSSHTVLTTALRQWLHGRTLTGEVDLSPAFVAAYQVPPFLIGTRAGVIHAVRSALNACYGDDPALAVRVAE